MCKDIKSGPACVAACPTGAAIRIHAEDVPGAGPQAGRASAMSRMNAVPDHAPVLLQLPKLPVCHSRGRSHGARDPRYVFCPLREPKSGGTWLGYTLGTIGALLIVYLAWYGVRRRTFGAGGSATGWLSAHVYFGFALMLVATLHCGFQFGWNVHTACYALLVLIVLSGAWGIYAYAKYPSLIIKQRGNVSRAESRRGDLSARRTRTARRRRAATRRARSALGLDSSHAGSAAASGRCCAGYDESAVLIPAGGGMPLAHRAEPRAEGTHRSAGRPSRRTGG